MLGEGIARPKTPPNKAMAEKDLNLKVRQMSYGADTISVTSYRWPGIIHGRTAYAHVLYADVALRTRGLVVRRPERPRRCRVAHPVPRCHRLAVLLADQARTE